MDRHRLDDIAPHIYKTRDGGKTWHPIAAGISAGSYVNVIREDSEKRGLLFAGTETGVFVSFDDGDHWQPLQGNLPNCSVRDISIRNGDLVIATHGRSFWVLDDIAPLRELTADRRRLGRLVLRPARGHPLPPRRLPGNSRSRRTSPPARTPRTARSSTTT